MVKGLYAFDRKVSSCEILEGLLREFGDQYLNVDELASYIKRSKGAIRNLVLRRAIPYRKPAGRLLFLKEEIDQWVKMSPGQNLEEILNN